MQECLLQQCGMIQLNNFLAIKANLLEQVYGVFVIVIMNHISDTTVTNYRRMYTSMCLQVVISRRRHIHTYTQLLSSSPQSSLSSFSTFHAVVNVLSLLLSRVKCYYSLAKQTNIWKVFEQAKTGWAKWKPSFSFMFHSL